MTLRNGSPSVRVHSAFGFLAGHNVQIALVSDCVTFMPRSGPILQRQNEKRIMINHSRIYSGALATLAVVAALSSGFLLFLAGASAGGSLDINLPTWSLPWVAAINFAYAVAIILTLCSRRLEADPSFELGTAACLSRRHTRWDLWIMESG
jgi:hypothetical protein